MIHARRSSHYSFNTVGRFTCPVIYNPAVRNLVLKIVAVAALGWNTSVLGGLVPWSFAQETNAQGQPKIQVNFLNSCRPSQGDLEEMGRALARVKERPGFAADFEVARGVTTLNEAEARAVGAPEGSSGTPSQWVRIRKEFPEKAALTSAQYSLSVDGSATSEMLALHLRDNDSKAGDVLQVLLSEAATGTATEVLKTDTPPDRIRVERFGKPSIVLARCGGMDQSAYEPVFRTAAEIFRNYRAAMGVHSIVQVELGHLPRRKESKAAAANH